MISEALSSIANVAVYPIVTLLLFFSSFLGMVIWALRMNKQEVLYASHLPLEDSIDLDGEGERANG